MINVNVDINNEAIKKYIDEQLKERLDELENEDVYWKKPDLINRAKMSWGTIQKNFFHDPNFPKFKSDGDWRFPVRECKAYLDEWWKNQPSGTIEPPWNQRIKQSA